jgi:CubicO group peptidase (beta-lactamase class C family)
VATTTAVMQLVEAGRIDLNRPVAGYWPAFAANGKAEITVRQLLTHTSGLAPDLDLAADWRGQDAALALAAAARPVHPPGTRFLYSDINFIVLAELVASVSGEPLDAYARRHIFQPLRMVDTGFTPPDAERARIAATDRQDGMLRWGQVQDPTAYRMGGVAGHAGLFSTADDLARFARMLLQGGSLDGVRILKPETVALMTRPAALPGGARRGLGWDSASPYSAGMDAAFGPTAYGHTGYTGCSLWIDPASQRFLILLTSRLHPDGHGDVKPLRRDLARLVGAVTRPTPLAERTLAAAATPAPALAQTR